MAGSSSPQHAQPPAVTGDGGERAEGAGGTTSSSRPKNAPGGPGTRIALRNWRISTRLVSLLALPVVAATSLGALRISESVEDIQQLDNMRLLTDMTKQATELAAALQQERDLSAGPLAHGATASDFTVKGVRDTTDTARSQFLKATQEIDDASADGRLPGVRDSLVGIATELTQLNNIRSGAYEDGANSTLTVEAYHRLINQLLNLSQDMAEATSNPEMIKRTRALAAFSSAKEYASVQRAVIAAALPANNTSNGELSESDRQYGLSALTSEDSDLDSFGTIYGREDAEELMKPISEGNATIDASDEYADRVLKNQNGLRSQAKRSYKDWVDDQSVKINQMKNIEGTLLDEMEQTARQLRSESERDAILSGAIILLVLGISLVGAFVVARSMIRSLRRLQDTATKVAQERLPELVKQLSEADPQDVDTSVESVGLHSKDEIGQVAAAFDDVHREAVRLAAEQALLRGNVNAMFTNLSRRSQGLIQRQLSLISELESREADPDQLSSLFKLDHLATRMRRNGENLLVLAGEEPGRRWTRPVPLVDVLRAAASEVEQYERIELASVPATEVAGRVVNDLVHLLAELLENATSFSSPQTKVKVTGHALPDGRVLIEIHDTGIGLSPEDLAAINERLAAPPTVDVSVSRRMGLFVVGRLSQRHGIRIQLRPSDSGGTTALVMLPVDVAQGGRKPVPGKPGQGGAPAGGPAAAQAAAGAAAARRGGNGRPGGPNGGAPGDANARPGGMPQRGQVGAGQGARAALPGSDQGGRPGGQRGPQGGPAVPPQGRPAPGSPAAFEQGGLSPAGTGGFGGQAPGAPQGLSAAGTGAPQNFDDSGRQGGFAGGGSGLRPAGTSLGEDAFGGQRQDQAGQGGFGDGAPAERGSGPASRKQPKERSGRRRPQLPGRGGPRAELPGGSTQPRTPSWSDENAQPPVPRASLDAPRGHEEPDSTSRLPRIEDPQDLGSTAAMPRVEDHRGAGADDFPGSGGEAPRGGQFDDGDGQFVRSDVFGGSTPGSPSRYPAPVRDNPQGPGQFPPSGQERNDTGQFPGFDGQERNDTGQFPGFDGQDQSDTGGYPTPAQDQNDTSRYPTPTYGQNDSGRFPALARDQNGTGQFPAPAHDPNGTGHGQYGTPAHEQNGTGQFPGFGQDQNGTGQFPGFGQEANGTGQFPAAAQDNGTGQFPAAGYGNQQDFSGTGRYEQPLSDGGADFGGSHRPEPQRPQMPQRPVRGQEPEALPPAQGPGDGRTPLFDTLETNWFRGGGRAGRPADTGQGDANGSLFFGGSRNNGAAQQPAPTEEQRPAAPSAAWRTSPNDELVRQAERARQPSAGGITTSGLPRRVPRANLVPGTAQSQQHHSGPQVSRAPDDVRGRLTNLRRGIAQGRQAGSGQTGSFPSPTHQQER
ncbi:histidine kinase [Streptomyces ruber]|uniref:histidine kinase n=2 Tax=Streptomyces ruber TaxID=83378 RepID=A0A918BIT9_9ACTN|nr:histidine kinase [Streptomyces ruber]